MSATIIGIVPARGGSKGIPHKNLQLINGVPLVIHACQILADAGITPRVSTDDHAIAATAAAWGYQVEDRPEHLAGDDVSIDDLVDVWRKRWPTEWLVVLQPTVPEIPAAELGVAVGELQDDPPEHGVAFTVPLAHQVWRDGLQLRRRAQRQDYEPLEQEVGCRVYPPGADELDSTYPLETPAIDIDTPSDLAAVRARMNRRRIVFRYRANREVGTGHYWRARHLGSLLPHHDVSYAPTSDTSKEWWLYPLYAFGRADVLVNDTLDTTTEEMLEIRGYAERVLALEDLGAGRAFADRAINALYEHGSAWAVLRPEFLGPAHEPRDPAQRVLVSFGGTDPAGLTERVAKMEFGVRTAVIVPPGRDLEGLPGWDWVEWIRQPRMAYEMLRSDVLVCSAGRTVFEAAALGVPAVVLAQNEREARHRHVNDGNIFLGVGSLVSELLVEETVRRLLGDVGLRRELSRRRIDGRGGERLVHLIEGMLL